MASLKDFIANSKSFVTGITGKALWSDAPAMTLEQVTSRIKAILGKDDQFADPDIDLTDTSSQIAAIIGLTGDDSVPEITLHGAKTHVDASIVASGTAHGITGMSVAPVALAGTAAAGSATTISRSDHVHPTTGLMLTSHAADAITGFGPAPPVLAAVAAAGDDTTVSRSDHVHPTTGLMLTSHVAAGITGWNTAPVALGTVPTAGSATTISRSDHVHLKPSLSDLGAAAAGGSSSQAFAALQLTTNSYNGLGHATYSGKVIPWDGRVDIEGYLRVVDSYVTTPAGRLNGYRSAATSAAFAFDTSGNNAWALTEGAFKVRNTGNTAYMDVYAKDYYANDVKVASDERLKRDIRPVSAEDGLQRLRDLKAASGVIGFRLKTDPEDAPERLGLSAQAVASAAPLASATFSNDEGEAYLGWNMAAMIALLVDAVATLDHRLSALEGRPGGRP